MSIEDVLCRKSQWYIECGDSLNVLHAMPSECISCIVTSPPYWNLRDYGVKGQYGLEKTLEKYIQKQVEVFQEIRRVLRNDGTLWLNMGDSYVGGGRGGHTEQITSKNWKPEYPDSKPYGIFKRKDLYGVPWRVAFALHADGWYLRSDIIWHKPNPMPMSQKDRPTTAHEYLFLLAKSEKYYYNFEAVQEECSSKQNRPHGIVKDRLLDYNPKEKELKNGLRPQKTPAYWHQGTRIQKQYTKHKEHANKQDGTDNPVYTGFNGRYSENPVKKRNKRDVWTIATQPFKLPHYATFPEALVEPCVLAGCPAGGLVLDPFAGGSGRLCKVALRLGCRFIGIDLNPEYVAMSKEQIGNFQQPVFEGVAG